MSETATPVTTALTPPIPSEPTWAKPAISIFALVVFLAAFGIAYLAKDSGALTLMMGAAISMAGTVVNYYLGSSSGSAKKTEIAAVAADPAKTP